MSKTIPPGHFIVIDGTDGSGKTSQTALLTKRLREAQRRVAVVDFPRYGLPAAYFIEQYLANRYGPAGEVDPHAAALFYALDRFDGKESIQKKIAQGQDVIANRYMAANLGHQGGKISSVTARRRFFRWADWLEHDVLGLPRPDCTIILHVPAVIAQRLVDKKGRRQYIQRKRDFREADLAHLKAAEQSYLMLPKLFDGYHILECVEKGKLLSPKKIHDRIWKIVEPMLG